MQCYSEPLLNTLQYTSCILLLTSALCNALGRKVVAGIVGFLCTAVDGEKHMAAVVLGCRKALVCTGCGG